jgi:hypothetical protein
MSFPITATYAPAPSFFRRPRTLRRWSSSTCSSTGSTMTLHHGSTTTTTSSSSSSDQDDTSSNDEDDSSSSGGSSSTKSVNSPVATTSSTQARRPPHYSTSSTAAVSRSQLRLSLALLRTRQALSSQSYNQLATALKALTTALPSSTASDSTLAADLGVFVPILERLAYDLETQLGGQDKGRDYRKSLSKEDAKALVALRQRWASTGQGGSGNSSAAACSNDHGNGRRDKGKSKQKDPDQDWVPLVRTLVQRVGPDQWRSLESRSDLTSPLCTLAESTACFSSHEALQLGYSSIVRLLGVTAAPICSSTCVVGRASHDYTRPVRPSAPLASPISPRMVLVIFKSPATRVYYLRNPGQPGQSAGDLVRRSQS